MKKKFLSIVIAVLCAGLLFCACQAPETVSGTVGGQVRQTEPATTQTATQPLQETETTAPAITRGDANQALKTLQGAISATSAEEIAPFVTGADDTTLQSLVDHYPKEEGNVNVSFAGQFQEYDIFNYDLSYNGEVFESGLIMLLAEDGSYKLCMDPQAQQSMQSSCVCSACGGAGGSNMGGNACGICGGTGQQYIPNAWFDGTFWQGQWSACGGCGGAGFVGSNWVGCGNCGGTGWKFN